MKTLYYSIITLLFLTIISCETDIPEVDNTAPKFSLIISGDEFSHTFKEGDDFDHMTLYIKNDYEYDISLTVSDQGGVKSTQLQYTRTYLDIISEVNNPWSQSSFDDHNDMVQWTGDVNNPVNGNIFVGKFKGLIGSAGFYVVAKDYGGEAGDVNTTSKMLFIVITDDGETELITN